MKIGIIVPVASATMWNNFCDSLHNMKVDKRFHWLLNFNGVDAPRNTRHKEFKRVELMRGEYDLSKGIPIAEITEDTALLMDDCDYYLIMDDDFVFMPGTSQYPMSSGERYIQAANYLERRPECGVLKCDSFLGGARQQFDIAASRNAFPEIKKGLFIKNLWRGRIFNGTSHLVGAGADLLMAYLVMSEGLYYAKQFNNPTRLTSARTHLYKMRGSGRKQQVLSDEYRGTLRLQDSEVWERNILKYIQDRWEPGWTPALRRLPKGIRPYIPMIGTYGHFSALGTKEHVR